VTPHGVDGAGIDLLRRLALETCERPELADVYEEFFPPPGKRIDFQPEPGCSDLTFIGSTTDVTALAAQLLDGALDSIPGTVRVSAAGEAEYFPRERTLCITRLAHDDELQLARTRLVLPHDRIVLDHNGIYQVRIDQQAMQQMRRFVSEMAAAEVPPDSETGGLLLGQFDDACRVAWVTMATGPPGGSLTSPVLLQLNAPAAQEFVQLRSDRTGGLTSFAGFWHTHPNGPASPSQMDTETMQRLLGEMPGHSRRLLLMVLAVPGSGSLTMDQEPVAWTPEIYAEVLTA
jgi:proteasome lid subunit RPN8/RPN11